MRGAVDLQLNIGELGQNGDQHALDRKGSGLKATDYGGGGVGITWNKYKMKLYKICSF